MLGLQRGAALFVSAIGWLGRCTFYEIRKSHNPWIETTSLARPLDLAPHIIYTVISEFLQSGIRFSQERGFDMSKYFLIIVILLMTSCTPSSTLIQTAVAGTQTVWTPVPTCTPQLTYTPQPTIVVTRVVVEIRTPVPPNKDSCKPLTNMDYSDNTKVSILLQAYVSQLPGVTSVHYVIPERLYSNTLSQLFHVQYTATDGKVYSKRYIVYLKEFGWQNATFSIDGQCWIDPPH